MRGPCSPSTAGTSKPHVSWIRLPGTKKKPGMPGLLCFATTSALHRLDVGSLFPLGARGDFERHLLALLQRLESRHVDRREMCEQIFAAAIGSNETTAFGVVKPLYSSSCHVFQFLKTENNRVDPGRCFDLKDRKVRLRRQRSSLTGRALVLETKHKRHYTHYPQRGQTAVEGAKIAPKLSNLRGKLAPDQRCPRRQRIQFGASEVA